MNYRVILILILVSLTGCSGVDIEQYRENSPRLDLFNYFTGKTKGYGIVQDRSGTLTRQFVVDITGTVDSNGRLTLFEEFDWNDGEESTRTWLLTQNGEHNLSGEAADVVDTAAGLLYGNVLNWRYQLNLKVDDSTWKINFDDWMFLVTDEILINKATMSKFGFTVGEVTIVFQK